MPKRPVPPLLGPGLVSRRLRVQASDVQLVKGLVEAHEGVANVFGEEGGELTLAAPADREHELEELLVEIDELLSRVHRRESGSGSASGSGSGKRPIAS